MSENHLPVVGYEDRYEVSRQLNVPQSSLYRWIDGHITPQRKDIRTVKFWKEGE